MFTTKRQCASRTAAAFADGGSVVRGDAFLEGEFLLRGERRAEKLGGVHQLAQGREKRLGFDRTPEAQGNHGKQQSDGGGCP